jgi:hypothetical protein
MRTLAILLLAAGCPSPSPTQPGTVPIGGACQYSIDCAQPQGAMAFCQCSGSNLLCEGTFPVPRGCGPVGGKPCPTGQYCTTFDPSGVCAPRPAAGGSCNNTILCLEGLFCNESSVCEAPRAAGQPCLSHDGCAAPAFCDPATNKCAPPRKLGEACDGAVDAYRRQCEAGLNCSYSRFLCVQPKANGASCTEDEDCLSENCPPPGDPRQTAQICATKICR